MKKLKSIIVDYNNLRLLYDRSVEINQLEYNSTSVKTDEEFKVLKEFYEKDFFIENNLSFNKMYIKIIKILWHYQYDCITPQEALDFLSKNYDKVFNDPKKYIKYFIMLCNDNSYLKKFINENKNKIIKNEDIIFKYFDIQNLSLYIETINDKSNLEKTKKIILDHIKKNIDKYLFALSENDYASFRGLGLVFKFLSKSNQKEWKELENYLLFLIKQNDNLHLIDIFIYYLTIFKKELKEINSIILNNNVSINHSIVQYVMNYTNEEFKKYFLKRKITSPWDVVIFKEAQDLKLVSDIPSFMLDIIVYDYAVCFTYFLSNVNINGRFYQLEKRMLKEKNFAAICKYAISFLRGPWKEAETILKESDEYWEIYNDFINSDDKEDYEDPLEEFFEA